MAEQTANVSGSKLPMLQLEVRARPTAKLLQAGSLENVPLLLG